MSWQKNTLLWISAFILMAAVAVYQRMTGPTHPEKGTTQISNKDVSYKLLRSENCGTDAPINIVAPAPLSAEVRYKRYKSHDTISSMQLARKGDTLQFFLPSQPAAGKIEYQVFVSDTTKNITRSLTKTPLLIRYKGVVPDIVLIVHVIFMFGAMLLAARTAFEALCKSEKTYKYTLWTVIFLAAGGLVLGPVVQKYAFGVFWAGWPFGGDMTDNKTIFTLLIWVLAMIQLKQDRRLFKWAIIAFVVMMVAYLIPHSIFGSELDYTKTLTK